MNSIIKKNFTRRNVLLATISTLAVADGTRKVRAADSNIDEILRLYGRPDTRHVTPDLEFLREAQELRPHVPIGIDEFNTYLDELPLMRRIKAGQSQDLYHLMQWNALALDLTAQDKGKVKEPRVHDQPPLNSTVFAHYYQFKEILTGHKLVNQQGKWAFIGTPIQFPSVLDLKPVPAGSNPSDEFSKILTKLLRQLEECWKKPGVRPDIGLMFQLQDEGKKLIQQSIRPEFVWSD
jgi:hypothetical protein